MIARSHEADDWIGGPAAAPIVMAGASGLTFVMGAFGTRKILLAPKSTSAVVRLSRRRAFRAAYFRRSLSHGVERGAIRRGAGLHLEGKANVVVEVKLTCLLHLTTLSRLPGDPPRHNPVTHPRGRLSFVFIQIEAVIGRMYDHLLAVRTKLLGPSRSMPPARFGG